MVPARAAGPVVSSGARDGVERRSGGVVVVTRGTVQPVGGRVRALQIGLVAVGVIFVFGIYPLVRLWPSGWSWGDAPYLLMIVTIYAVLGIFLVLAAADPLANRSLIRFTVWSSLAHAATMTVQSLLDPAAHGGHLLGDVPALVLVAIVLAVLLRRAEVVDA